MSVGFTKQFSRIAEDIVTRYQGMNQGLLTTTDELD